MKIKRSLGERIFDAANCLFLTTILFCTLYPCWYVLMASMSDPNLVQDAKGIVFYPLKFGLYSYIDVLKYSQLWISYRNTVFYVIFGGIWSVSLTMFAAFALSRRNLPGKNGILMFIMITMYFSGGLIPTYLVIKGIGLLDNPLVMMLPGVAAANLIITLSYFRSMPYELEESAKIDGANDYTVLFRIMIPLAKPIIAVISLYYMVAIWNNYFTGLIYLKTRSLFPLQMILREILIQNSTAEISMQTDSAQAYAENVKYAVIVVSTVPILCVYPFLQRFFIKGVMIGAIKG